jgi:alkylhydroperoxidase/carboxymuconolactone decarboxylase family protein YurZ
MRKSGSRTHQGWLANLELRAKTETEHRSRFLKHYFLLRMSDALGSVIGRRGMQALYHSYFLSYLPKSMFTRLFSTYKPALVVSTTAHHAEAWPLTYFGRRHGCKTVANILSWDNTSTKPAMDTSCDCYMVWSSEMEGEFARHYPYVTTKLVVTGSPLFDMYYKRRGAMDRANFLTSLGLSPDRPYVLWTTNTPAGMPDEHKIIRWFWDQIGRTPLAGKISLLVRLHPKEDQEKYTSLLGLDNVALTLAGSPHWDSSDRWLPSVDNMGLLLNSMMHAAVSVNVASTMSLESFALNLPTINVAFKSSDTFKDHNLMWSFDMYHTSEHYRAIVDNGAVALARNMDELLAQTIDALEHPDRRQQAMRETLEQKAAYCDGTSARHFVEALIEVAEVQGLASPAVERLEASGEVVAIPVLQHEGAVSSKAPQRKKAMAY